MTSDVLVKIDGDRLVVSIPLLDTPTPSKSVKSKFIASVNAKLDLPAAVLGKEGYAMANVHAGHYDPATRDSTRTRKPRGADGPSAKA